MIEIKDISGKVRFSTPINKGAKGKFTLMKEDYIILPFSVSEPIPFKLGDYVDLSGVLDESLGGILAKIYEITDIQKPSYNTSTGGYDYELQMNAYYWKWKNKIFKYTPEQAGSEASWSLTAALDVQLGVFLRNLKALGYTYRGTDFTFSIDDTVENKAVAMTYDNMNLLDALFSMAGEDKWNCDCWITDNIIHFGRCEFGDAVKIERGVEASSITRSESQGTYATRIYAFGSTKNIPTNYRPTDEQAVINGVVQKRLMLPADTPYIDAYEGMSQEEAIEDVVVFDDVYPRRVGTLSDVHTRIEEVENEDGTKETVTYYRYKDTGLEFKEEYIIEGQELKIRFQSGKLNGMEFGVIFNPTPKDETRGEQLWEIVRNEDYGRALPDDMMYPSNGDEYILSGFDIQLVSDQYIPDAEQELKEKAQKYADKVKKDDGTYPTTLRSSWVKEDLASRTFEFGQRINLVDDTYFENGRISRVLGWEMNLDIPWDSPVYTIGESMPYSRIGEIEDKVDSLTYKGQTYTGGGGSGVYVIRTNDSTAPSDSNVFSALRSLATLLRKDQKDSTRFLVQFFAGLEAGLYAEGGKDGSKLHADGLAELGRLQVNGDSEFRGNLSSKDFVSGFAAGKGWAIMLKKVLNAAGVEEEKSVMELDDLIVRGTLRVLEFVISQMLGENDNRTFTAMLEVDHYDSSTGKVYLDTQDGRLYNPFRADDYIMVQQYNGMPSEDNDYYVTKEYELIITEVGMEGDYAWAKFKNFTTTMEGGNEALITKGDTFVRIDNLSDLDRKGIIQMMTVGSNTPYMDVIYGAKTDPDNSLKVRIGKLEGIYHHLFGWLKSFGAYIINLYAVGEYRQRNTGEDLDTKIEMLKEQFLTSYTEQYYNLTDEDNFLKNTAFVDLSYWQTENDIKFLSIKDAPLYLNRSLMVAKYGVVAIEEYNGKNMLRISNNGIRQLNEDIRKPDTHKEYQTDDDGIITEKEVKDTLYLSVRIIAKTSGTMKIGFEGASQEEGSLALTEVAVDSSLDSQIFQFTGTWDGQGDFVLEYTGDMFVSLLSLTTDPLANYKIETSTRFEQTSKYIELVGQKVDSANQNVTELGIRVDAAEENVRIYAEQVNENTASISQLQVDVSSIRSSVTSITGTAEDAKELAESAKVLAENAGEMGVYGQETYSQTTNPWNNWSRGTEHKHVGAIWYNPSTGDTQVYTGTDNSNSWEPVSESSYVTATYFLQNKDKISAIATQFDSNGKPTADSGIVLKSQFASLFSEALDADGNVVTKADLTTYVQYNPDTGEVLSNIKITADQIELEGYTTINDSFSVDSDGTTHIGGFRVAGNGLTNADSNGAFTNDAYIIFRNDAHNCFAGIGGNVASTSTGLRALARFENRDRNDWWGLGSNYAVLISAQGADNNIAIAFDGGYVSCLAYKTETISYTKTISRDSVDVVCTNTSEITVELPTMYYYDDGHVVKIKNLNGRVVHIRPGYSYHTISNSSRKESYIHADQGTHFTNANTDTLTAAGDAAEYVYHRDINNGSQYGCWVQHKNPRDW